MKQTIKLLGVLLVSLVLVSACAVKQDNALTADGFSKRDFNPMLDGRWIGNGISYSPYRDGENPDMEQLIAKENVLEDLQILGSRWNLIRLYGADPQHQQVLEVIRDNDLPIRVMQGAWISGHQTDQENQQQVDTLIRMANEFPEIIVAVNVGNEIFVDWSWHKVKDMDQVIDYIRQVRSSIRQPVTVNDDYNFWNKPHAQKVAAELDFIGLHAYAFWNNKTLDVAMDWTLDIYNDIQSRHPEHLITYTETGWPTSRIYGDGSYEGGLIGKAGEDEQQVFFEQYNAWVDDNRIISLYFAAFDEEWKGGFDGDNPMAKAEKHWGVYRTDRSPKKLLQ
ncbi:MAG: glycosyl hydrolase family 17 [Gammaproteobacteria bacterium]|nr:glycosyl hydrolase family 17 [Gammaproteobacteria bacterium]